MPATRPSSAQPAFDKSWAPIRAGYKEMLEENGIVGSSLAFVHDGRILAWETAGFADLDTERRVDRETIYHWASITKTFTGIAIMQLRDRGLLSLDDPILDYLPELEAVHNPFGPMSAITLRHLLSHSAGFRASTWPWGGGEPWHPHEPKSWAQLAAMMPYTEIEFEPDSRYSYSNPGIIFLGRVIELLSGDDYEVYIDKNIFKPLGMTASYFDGTPYHLLKHRSNNYTVSDGKPIANGLDFDTGITVSNGGLNAPIGDMIAYLNFLTGSSDAEKQHAYDAILARSSLAEMWTIRHEVGMRGPYKESVALAFHVLTRDAFRAIGHTGSQKAFMSFFYIDPAARTAVITAFNTVGESGEAPQTRTLMNRLREQLFEEAFEVFSQ